jgi:hypothetical protein
MNMPTTTTASGSPQLVFGGAGGGAAGVGVLLDPGGVLSGVRGAVSTAVDVPPDSRGTALFPAGPCPFLESVT